MKKITQGAMILRWFDEGHEVITPLDAYLAYKIMRLAARIMELEKAGYKFEHETVWTRDERGKVNGHFTQYRRLDNGKAVHQAV